LIPAIIAVRHSKAKKASRRAVLYALASHADENGNNAFPKYDTLQLEAGAGRETVAGAIKEALENEEIVATGKRPGGTIIYSFAPLIKRVAAEGLAGSSTVELLRKAGSSKTGTGSSISGFAVRKTGFRSSTPVHDEAVKKTNRGNQEEGFPSGFEATTSLTANELRQRVEEVAEAQEDDEALLDVPGRRREAEPRINARRPHLMELRAALAACEGSERSAP